MEALRQHRWPGNIRELMNVIERACSFADSTSIELADLPPQISGGGGGGDRGTSTMGSRQFAPTAGDAIQPSDLRSLAFKVAKEEWISSFEQDYILALLRRNNNNISHAAREAEIDRKYFRKLMKKYDIEMS
jgi:DNA-binding NtrC family response regulator